MNEITRITAEYLLETSTRALTNLSAVKEAVGIDRPLTEQQYRNLAAAFYAAESLHRRLTSVLVSDATVDPLAADVEQAEAMIGRAA